MILLDSSFLYALNDARDRNHARTVAFVRTLSDPLLLPVPVLPEVCYLLHSRLGHKAMRRFLSGLATSDIQLVSIYDVDMQRIVELVTQYADAKLDFADAAIVAIAERLGIRRILTFDRRDFLMIRPRHCGYFELLP